MRVAAILPVKRFPLAKQRLGESVADSLRADLARAMVGDVLSALRECPAIDATIVVTCEPSVMAAARYVGAIVVEDSAEDGQSAAASLGLARAALEGFERALCVPGDCPTLDPAELTKLLLPGGRDDERPSGAKPLLPGGRDDERPSGAKASGADADSRSARPPARAGGTPKRQVTIVPDRHGSGTNGLLLSPPDAIRPSFGPDSRARHERLAREAGAEWRVEQPPSLLLDIDTGADLAVLHERLASERVRAPRTRAVLARTVARTDAENDGADDLGTALGQGSHGLTP
jgi:2-phospho-L-lactate/phosphoenolpyruvate guanylyltransferase